MNTSAERNVYSQLQCWRRRAQWRWWRRSQWWCCTQLSSLPPSWTLGDTGCCNNHDKKTVSFWWLFLTQRWWRRSQQWCCTQPPSLPLSRTLGDTGCCNNHDRLWAFKKTFFNTSLIPCRTSVSPYLGEAASATRDRATSPYLPCNKRSTFLCPDSGMTAGVLALFNMHTDVDACNCAQRLYGHHNRVCTESWL